ncbi:MAG: CBS domain-containing protein, partial [Candidatus Helarchaeota archaeon]|nr:CBS domain-containing protein [Candidatus Helarchaeota archaeon]
TLLNISEFIDLKFFVYVSSQRLKTSNIYTVIPSEWARGKLEMLLVSIIFVDEDFNRLYVFEEILEKIVAAINKIDKAYMGFYSRYRDKSNIKAIDTKKIEITRVLESYLPEITKILEEEKKNPLDSEVIATDENIQDEFTILQRDENTIEAARKLAANPRILLGCVLDKNNHLMGVLDEDDILNQTTLIGKDPALVKVEDIMTKNLLTVDAKDPIENAINLMLSNEIEAIPILQAGKFIGVFTIFDAASHYKNLIGLIGDNLKDVAKTMFEDSKKLKVELWSYIKNISKNRKFAETMKKQPKKAKKK